MQNRDRLAVTLNNPMRDIRKPRRFIGVLGKVGNLTVTPTCESAALTAIELRLPGRESPVDSTMSKGRLKLVSAGTVRRGGERGNEDDPV